MVTSYSNPLKPHLVSFAMTNGKFTCDCYNGKSKRICAHTLATAERMGLLPKFMTWYKTEVKGLSLWNLVRSSGVPKNPGEKPRSKKRTRKVKPKVVTASSLLNIPTPTSSPKGKRRSSSANEQKNDVSLSPCVSPTIPFNATVPPTQMGWIGNPPSPYGYPPFPSPHGYPPSHSPYAYPSYSGYPSSSYPSHSRQPQFSPYSSYTGHQLHSFPTTQTVYKSPVPNHPFVLKFITSRISKCQGCKQQFRQAAKQSLNPPHDLSFSIGTTTICGFWWVC